ncbi:hypothetical protein, partial [Thiorhodococcus minor]
QRERHPQRCEMAQDQRRDPQRSRASLRDTFASLKKTCRKLGISFWDDLNDRIGQVGDIPPLPDIVRERILAAEAVP